MPGLNEVETLDVTDTLEVTHVTGDEREAGGTAGHRDAPSSQKSA